MEGVSQERRKEGGGKRLKEIIKVRGHLGTCLQKQNRTEKTR